MRVQANQLREGDRVRLPVAGVVTLVSVFGSVSGSGAASVVMCFGPSKLDREIVRATDEVEVVRD